MLENGEQPESVVSVRENVISSCVQTLYALRLLRARTARVTQRCKTVY